MHKNIIKYNKKNKDTSVKENILRVGKKYKWSGLIWVTAET